MGPSKVGVSLRHGSLGSARRLRSGGKAVTDRNTTNGTRIVACFIARVKRYILLILDDFESLRFARERGRWRYHR